MKQCCATCARQFIIERLDYSEKGCQHSYEAGFICMVAADEGIAYHMVGCRAESEQCEGWVEREN